MRRFVLATACVALLATLAPSTPAGAALAAREQRQGWRQRIDSLIEGRPVGVAVFHEGFQIYGHDERRARIPASNQKLLLSMSLLAAATPERRFETIAAANGPPGRTLSGDLWILGTGDPALTAGGRFGRSLPFRATRVGALARRIKATGIRRIRGSIIGSTGYFARDWFAPGWKSSFPREEVPLPSALTFEGNEVGDTHIDDPELRVSRALTRRLEKRGVRVAGRPAAGAPPAKLSHIVTAIRSAPLPDLLAVTNKQSSNFFAEVLGKALAVETFGAPGTIANGARAIESWAASAEAVVDAYDASGLSYANRVTARALARLVSQSSAASWGTVLRRTLPAGGQGTLEHRLEEVRVRAKTGTLDEVSALAGFVYLERARKWAQFAILSGGLSKDTAVDLEDRIVRLLARRAG